MASPPDLPDLLRRLEEHPRLGGQSVHRRFLPASPETFGEIDPPLPPALSAALAASGVERLWSHQAEGLAAARARRDVLVTTPTASGKSLIFQLPVLEEALAGGRGRALFLFPLKALGQDQRGKIEALAQQAGLSEPVAAIYDGDTPTAERKRIRDHPPRVLITNPDMLHLGILAHWQSWTPFLRDLSWVVLDELHTYRGLFGSHFHHVLQRLLRLARIEGAEPAVIASSATAANAAEFAAALVGRPCTVVETSGAPRQGRHLVLYRPEASPYTTALDLLTTLLDEGLKTIVFTKARRITELLYSWLRRRRPELGKRVVSYRAGFLAEERRSIEQQLFDGTLDGVISTSALEMGIDIGGLDACLLVGYPGSVMATWQRSGRVGRAGRESLTALVALPDALDQYLLDHPGELLDRPCERLMVDPSNPVVAGAHLVCAATERALRREADAALLERHGPLVRALVEEGELLESADGRELFARRRRPHRDVTLRGAGRTCRIRRGAGGPVIGTVDGPRAPREAHPGAVYLHQGRQYLVTELDLEAGEALAEAVDVDYFTTPLTEKETMVLEVLGHSSDGPLHAWTGRLRVKERTVGYERKQMQSQEVQGRHPLDLPAMEFETVGLWWSAGRDLEETLQHHGEQFMGSLHAAEHAALALLPTFALCDRGDLGGISLPFHPQVGTGAVFLYDGHAGGAGITTGIFDQLSGLLERVLQLLDACPCDSGCPSCIQSPKCGNGNRPLDKAGAARLLRLLLAQEVPVVPASPTPEMRLDAIDLASEAEREDDDGEEVAVTPVATVAPVAPERASLESETAEDRTGETSPAAPARRRGGAKRKGSPAAAAKSGASSRRKAGDGLSATVLFDLETLRSAEDVGGWNKAHRMGVAVGVVCFLEENRFEVYEEAQVMDLVAALRSADLVIGFNSKGFDYKVLNGYTGEDYARTLPTLDLLEDIHRRLGHRLGLDHLAAATLGVGKSADGLQSLEWVRQGRLDLVRDYCLKDVEILRDLYLFGRREGYVLYRPRGSQEAVRLAVDW